MGCWLSSGLQSQWNPCASQVVLVAKGKKKESLLLSSLLCNPTVCSPLSMGFSSQEHWSGLPFSPPGDLPIQGIKPGFLHLLYCRRIFFFYHWVTNLPANAGRCKEMPVWALGWKDPESCRIERPIPFSSTPVFLPGESHGQRSLATGHRVVKSQAQLKRLNTQAHASVTFSSHQYRWLVTRGQEK